MFATIKSIFASTANAARMVEEATEQGLEEVQALRKQRRISNAQAYQELEAEFAKAFPNEAAVPDKTKGKGKGKGKTKATA